MTRPICLLVLLVSCKAYAGNLDSFIRDFSDETAIERCSNQKYKRNERNSYLWTLKEYPTVFIFGSIHRPYVSVWPMIPRNVKKVFKSSEKVYFEIDLTNINYLKTIAQCKLLPNKGTLSDLLPENTLRKLKKRLSYVRTQIPSWLQDNGRKNNNGQYFDKVFSDMTMNWNRMRPIWISMLLTSLNKHDVRTNGVPSLDLYLFLKARKTGKEIGNIETAEEHCGLNNINTSQAIIYLDKSLTKYELAKERKITLPDVNELTFHYLCGNLTEFIFQPKTTHRNFTMFWSRELQDFEKALEQELLVKRNENIANKIIEEIQSLNPKEGKKLFFTIGAGHLIGKGGVIDILEARGLKTKHVKNKNYKARYNVAQNKRKKAKRKQRKMSQKLVAKTKSRIRNLHSAIHSRQNHVWTTTSLKRVNMKSSTTQLAVNSIEIIVYVVLVIFITTLTRQS